MDNLYQILQHFIATVDGDISHWFAPATTSFALIFAAEIGDKSQLVCMTLAVRHRALPVLSGAILAFALLNTLAVVFGIAIASWFPDYLIAATVALLFAVFGTHALLLNEDEEDDAVVTEKKGHTIFFTTLVIIILAEFGDKTQLAVIALSTTAIPAAVWLGSTAALITTSALGVLAGRTILQKLPLIFLHRLSGLLFIGLAMYAAYTAYLKQPYF